MKLLSLPTKRGGAGTGGPTERPPRTRLEAQVEQLAALVDDLEFRMREREADERKWAKRWAALLKRLFGSAPDASPDAES